MHQLVQRAARWVVWAVCIYIQTRPGRASCARQAWPELAALGGLGGFKNHPDQAGAGQSCASCASWPGRELPALGGFKNRTYHPDQAGELRELGALGDSGWSGQVFLAHLCRPPTMLERRRAAWQSCKTFPYTIHFKTFVFLPKTTQTPPSSRETWRAHHHPDATQLTPSAPPSAPGAH